MSDCDVCHGESGESASLHVVLPYRDDDAIIHVNEARICQVCAGELVDYLASVPGADAG